MTIEAIILSVIGSVLLILVTIVGWFIRNWMKQTEKREDRGTELIEKTNTALSGLNDTMNKINLNLETYQASMSKEIEHVKDKVETHKNIYIKDKVELVNKIDEHETTINDLNIRTTINEREVKKITETIDNIQNKK